MDTGAGVGWHLGDCDDSDENWFVTPNVHRGTQTKDVSSEMSTRVMRERSQVNLHVTSEAVEYVTINKGDVLDPYIDMETLDVSTRTTEGNACDLVGPPSMAIDSDCTSQAEDALFFETPWPVMDPIREYIQLPLGSVLTGIGWGCFTGLGAITAGTEFESTETLASGF